MMKKSCLTHHGYQQVYVVTIVQLFRDSTRLIPNLIDIRLFRDDKEPISLIIKNYPKLKRFDIGYLSPLPLLSLNHLMVLIPSSIKWL
jgi:hypothetical protein